MAALAVALSVAGAVAIRWDLQPLTTVDVDNGTGDSAALSVDGRPTGYVLAKYTKQALTLPPGRHTLVATTAERTADGLPAGAARADRAARLAPAAARGARMLHGARRATGSH